MTLKTKRMDVWVAPLENQPGGLAKVLRTIAEAGANLDCVVARREGMGMDKGVVFATPLEGATLVEKAVGVGFRRAEHIHTLRIEGDDRPGLGADLSQAIAEVGVNMHGFTAAAAGHRFVGYASFDTRADLERAETAVAGVAQHRFPKLRATIQRALEKDKAAARS